MKNSIVIDELGKLDVNENIWTGRISVSLDGKELKRLEKRSFELIFPDERRETLTVAGNIFSGKSVYVNGKTYTLTSRMPWYGYALSFIPFILTLVLGNIPALVQSGFYFVGGAIGGLIGGLFTAFSLYANSWFKKWYFRVLISLAFILISFLVCWGIGTAIVAATRR